MEGHASPVSLGSGQNTGYDSPQLSSGVWRQQEQAADGPADDMVGNAGLHVAGVSASPDNDESGRLAKMEGSPIRIELWTCRAETARRMPVKDGLNCPV